MTTSEFDTNGNLTRRIVIPVIPANQPAAPPPEARLAYNAHGQLIAITNAADANGYRRVDMFGYYTNGPQAGYLQYCTRDQIGHELTHVVQQSPRGRITSITDPLGNDWLFNYNSLDQCVRVQPPTNLTSRCATDFYYDENDNHVRTTTELRDAADNFICGKTDHFRVNPLGLTTSIESGVDCSTYLTNAFVYDGNDQCVLVLGPAAVSGADPHQTSVCQYDERDMLYRTVAAPGSADQSTTQCDYDSNGNIIRVSEGLEGTPSVTTMEHDGFAGFPGPMATPMPNAPMALLGQKAKAWMVNNYEVHPVAAAKGLAWVETVWNKQCVEKGDRVSSITDPMGNVTTFNYDANDNLRTSRHFGETNDVPGTNGNIRLAETRYSYDGLDRLSASHDAHFSSNGQPIGDGYRTTSFAFAPNGQCTGITDDLGRTTAFYHDTAGRGIYVTSPGLKTSFAILLDAGGRATNCARTDRSDLGGPPQVFSWTNVFDSLGRCVSSTDNVGNNENWDFDSLNRCVKHTDANSIVSFFSYDMLGREMLSVRDLNGNGAADSDDISVSTYWVDPDPRWPSSTVDSHGNTTSYGYDSLGRCTSITNADGTRHTLVWSPRSNLIQETDANGTVVTHTYDSNDRCTTNQIAPGAGVATTTLIETFRYDGSSRLVAAANDVSSCAFTYDSHDNRVSETRNGLTTSSTYDSLGNRLSLTYPGGRALTYAYNVLDLCTNIAEASVSLASFDYDSPDRLARISYANGMRTRIFYDGIAGTPNTSGDFGHGQVRRIVHAMAGGSPTINTIMLAWDPNQNKLQRDDAIFQPAIPRTNSLMLDYDAADRLIESVVVSNSVIVRDTVYGLDRMGNRTNVTGAACSGVYDLSSATPPTDYQMNQYTATPCDSRAYDANGNLTRRNSPATGPTGYQYDYADRLVQAQVVDFGSGSAVITTSSYAYDALGRRVSKTVSSGGLPPVTTEYSHDIVAYKDNDDRVMRFRPGNVIEERENGTVAASFVLDGSRSQDDGVIQMRRGGQDYYFHTDDQGNVLALTTDGGAVEERYDYDDYGKVTFLTSDGLPTTATASAVGNPYSWGGLRLDSETGLYNDDAGGYHEPQTGRAVPGKVKVVRDTGSGFVGNNPWSGAVAIYYNPKEIGIDKAAPWQRAKGKVTNTNPPENKGVNAIFGGNSNNPWSGGDFLLKKEEGGRHTPFHNKYRPQYRIFTTVSNVLKTKHDTVKNSIGNIR